MYTLPDGVKEFPYDVQKIYSRLQKHNNILIVSTPYMEYAYPDNYVLQE
ncbi:hypothetical protein GW750_07230 [bacterium]|nr:hypothetical protein [bacterium]